MADERIDVEVNDKVSSSVEKKLRGIGNAAGDAHKYVERLKADLATMSTTGMLKLETAANSTTRALAAQMNAQARLEAATAKSAVASAKAATEQQKLATEVARTEAAQSRATAAAASAATATARAAAAAQKAAGSTSDLAGRAERLKASLDPLYAAQMRFNAELNEANTLLRTGAIDMNTYQAAVARADGNLKSATAAQNAYNTNVAKGGKTAGLAAHQTGNLVAQLNDIGVSLASGQKPWLVFIQQGSQIQYLASTVEGGFKTLALSALKMAAPFAAAGAVFGVVTAEFVMWKKEVEDQAGIKEYVKTLGLTTKELKKLKDQHVTFGDTVVGVWDTIKEAMNLDATFASLADGAKSVVDFIWQTFKNFSFGLTGLFAGMFEAVRQLFLKFPAIVGEQIVNAINLVIDGINWLGEKSNDIFGTSFGKMDKLTNKWAGTTVGAWNAVADSAVKGFEDSEKGYNAFVKRAGENTIAETKKRLKKGAQTIIDDRTPKKGKVDHTAENRALALAKVNAELDNELSRMNMLKDARAEQQRFDQIEEQLLGKKIKLTDGETAAIKAKIAAIEADKYVQSERDRLYEEAIGPARDMNATIDAATQLYDKGAISLDKYSGALVQATDAFDKATNPLYELEKAYDMSAKTVRLYGDEIERATYLESINQAYKAKGLSMYDSATGKLKDEVTALIAKNDALREQQKVQSVVAGIVNPMLDQQNMLANEQAYYAELQRLRSDDTINQQQYEQAKYDLQAKFSEMRLQNTSDMFGKLATLSSSGNKELAAIGKAAAVAQATIDGYLAFQKALASAPPPINFISAAAVAVATGAQVAGILSTNVGNFATGGQFMVQGQGGVDQNNINMNVSRGERITVETAAQQRQNDGGAGATIVENKTKINNLFDEKSFIGAMDSEEGEEVVMNIIRRRRGDVNQITGNGGNS